MRLKFLWRNQWLCPWSAQWTLFNINVLLKNASFASKVALWAALEPMGRLQGLEWSCWLLFITPDCWLPRMKTLNTTWQGREVSIYSLALKLLRLVWPKPPHSWKDSNIITLFFKGRNFRFLSLAALHVSPSRIQLCGFFSNHHNCVL